MSDLLDTPPDVLFVTSTGTEVGKTLVSALLVRLLLDRVDSVGYFKPVASGCAEGEGGYRSPDERVLLERTSLGPDDVQSGLRFRAPLSPDRAAARKGRGIELADVIERCDRFRRRYRSVVVEGIGGVAVPFNPRRDVSDLAAALDSPVVMVVPSKLGTISYTRTAVGHLRAKGAGMDALVMTPQEGEEIEEINREHLTELYPDCAPVLIPRLDTDADWERALSRLEAL